MQIIFLKVLLLLFFSLPLFGYLDPASSSMLLQILASVFFGILFAVKLFWSRIKNLFQKKNKE